MRFIIEPWVHLTSSLWVVIWRVCSWETTRNHSKARVIEEANQKSDLTHVGQGANKKSDLTHAGKISVNLRSWKLTKRLWIARKKTEMLTEFAVTFSKTSLGYSFQTGLWLFSWNRESTAVDDVSYEKPVRPNKPISEEKLITCCARKKTRSFQISLLAKHLEGREKFWLPKKLGISLLPEVTLLTV